MVSLVGLGFVSLNLCFSIALAPPGLEREGGGSDRGISAQKVLALLYGITWSKFFLACCKREHPHPPVHHIFLSLLAEYRRANDNNLVRLKVKELFKAQRDDGDSGGDEDDAMDDASSPGSADAGEDAQSADDARSMAVEGTLKSALRMACTVTEKI